MIYNDGIRKGLDNKLKDNVIARKVYLSYPTDVFKDKLDIEFDVLNEISEYFNIPFNHIQIAGSAKTGYSYHKKKEFILGKSDLDIAIIDESLFTKYLQVSYRTTRQYSDLTKFHSKKEGVTGNDIYISFLKYIAKGYFRPDLMPDCTEKSKWFEFFSKLSDKYFEIFKSINGGIYCNQYFFESKQSDNIKKYKELRGGIL
jgi:hypothetical protein